MQSLWHSTLESTSTLQVYARAFICVSVPEVHGEAWIQRLRLCRARLHMRAIRSLRCPGCSNDCTCCCELVGLAGKDSLGSKLGDIQVVLEAYGRSFLGGVVVRCENGFCLRIFSLMS